MESIGLYIYTHTDCEDVWNAAFGRIDKYCDKIKNKYVFVNKYSDKIPENYKQLIYEDNLLFSEKNFMCLKEIKEDYVINLHEDFILYDYVDLIILSNPFYKFQMFYLLN